MPPKEVGQAIQPAWRRASFCGNTECVEVVQRNGTITFRDSTQPRGTMLHYAANDFGAFVRQIKSGRLDSLEP